MADQFLQLLLRIQFIERLSVLAVPVFSVFFSFIFPQEADHVVDDDSLFTGFPADADGVVHNDEGKEEREGKSKAVRPVNTAADSGQ